MARAQCRPRVTAGWTELSADQRRRADAITQIAENDAIAKRYDAIEDLGDGRGYTAGSVGFTSRDGDMLEVIERYTHAMPGNPLAPFGPRLRKRAAAGSGGVEGLEGLPAAWAGAAADLAFRRAQDEVEERRYRQPALENARDTGLRTPLSIAVFLDTAIQHGTGDDPDSLGALIQRTTRAVGGTPATGVEERRWLSAFLAERRRDLENPADAKTAAVWRRSVDRVDVYRTLLDRANTDLHGPLQIRLNGLTWTIR